MYAGLSHNLTAFYVETHTSNYGATGHPRVLLLTETPGLGKIELLLRRPNSCNSTRYGIDQYCVTVYCIVLDCRVLALHGCCLQRE